MWEDFADYAMVSNPRGMTGCDILLMMLRVHTGETMLPIYATNLPVDL